VRDWKTIEMIVVYFVSIVYVTEYDDGIGLKMTIELF